MAEVLDAMVDLLRRLPPTNSEKNIAALIELRPDLEEDLLGCVDQPLKVLTDGSVGRDFLCCEYNRDGSSYRSPWSNEYNPPIDDGTVPTARLRKLEIAANEAFDTYREMYYEGGVSSVYLWEQDDGGFAGVVLLKKTVAPPTPSEPSGTWDSIHVFEASERGRHAYYKLTSTVMLQLETKNGAPDPNDKSAAESATTRSGDINLSGSMTRQNEFDFPLAEPTSHITNIGKMIEDVEIKMRTLLQDVYFGKTKDIVFDLRSVEDLEQARRQRELQKELVGFMKS